jgi:nitric oxide dioxygenase
MLSDRTIQIVKATAPAVAPQAEAITRSFYQLMFAGNPETLAFFNQAHQHSGAQQRALAGAICAYAANIENLAALGPAVELIAQKHCSLGIQPEHYPIVGKHLLAAIKDVLGDVATPDVLAAWGDAYGLLAKVFIDREREIYKEQVAAPGGWNGYRPFVVAGKAVESSVITSFYLRPADGEPLPPFKPGQYVTVKFDNLPTPTAPRNYSLSDRPRTEFYRISVKREVAISPGSPAGIVSNHLHDRIQERDVISVGPPCGEFTLDPAAPRDRPVVFLSGGIGITPIMAMLKSHVHHEVKRLAAEHPDVHTHICYDAPLIDDLPHNRCDRVGFINRAFLESWLPSSDADFYFCGPKPFMASLYRDLSQCGVDASRLHFEFFGPKEDLAAA